MKTTKSIHFTSDSTLNEKLNILFNKSDSKRIKMFHAIVDDKAYLVRKQSYVTEGAMTTPKQGWSVELICSKGGEKSLKNNLRFIKSIRILK